MRRFHGLRVWLPLPVKGRSSAKHWPKSVERGFRQGSLLSKAVKAINCFLCKCYICVAETCWSERRREERPSPYPYPRAPFSAHRLCRPQVISKPTAWGKYRVAKTRFQFFRPHRWGNALSRNENSCSIFAFASSSSLFSTSYSHQTGLRRCGAKCK